MSNEILDLAWNPTQPNLIVVCMSDGTAKLLEVTENLKIMATLPAVVAARSGKSKSWQCTVVRVLFLHPQIQSPIWKFIVM
jgi:hypothetical protein